MLPVHACAWGPAHTQDTQVSCMCMLGVLRTCKTPTCSLLHNVITCLSPVNAMTTLLPSALSVCMQVPLSTAPCAAAKFSQVPLTCCKLPQWSNGWVLTGLMCVQVWYLQQLLWPCWASLVPSSSSSLFSWPSRKPASSSCQQAVPSHAVAALSEWCPLFLLINLKVILSLLLSSSSVSPFVDGFCKCLHGWVCTICISKFVPCVPGTITLLIPQQADE